MHVFSGLEGRPVIVGHRGLRAEGVAENTPAAFRAAAEAGAEWMELDVRRSADGALVVYHNGWTAQNEPVVAHTAEQLRALGIASLDEVLAAMPAGIGLNIEIKNLPGEPDYDPDDTLLGPLVQRVEPLAPQRPLLLSSFNPLTVQRLVRRLPDVPCGLIHYNTLGVVAAAEIAREQGAVGLCSRVGSPQLDAAGIAVAHDAGLSVMAWTVNDVALARELAAAGIDAVCTDDPGGLRTALDATARG